MLTRGSAAWLAIALIVGLLGYWAGRQTHGPRQAPPMPAKAAAESPGGKAAAGAASPSTGPATSNKVPTTEPSRVSTAEETATRATTGTRAGTWPDEPPAEPDLGAGGSPSGLDSAAPWVKRASEPFTQGVAKPAATGGETVEAVEQPKEVASAFHLYDGFEAGNAWAVESAADHAELSLADTNASEGQKALKAVWKAFGKGNFELRREVKLDLTDATSLRLDVYNDGGPLDLVLGVRGGYDATLFTTPPQPLARGWNRDVTFRLADLTFAEKGPWGTSWTWARNEVGRLSLIFRERDEKEGTVYVDNLRFDHPATKIGAKAKPVLRSITASAQAIERYETLELTVAFSGSYQNFFDRSEVDLWGAFFAPSGKRQEVKGYLHDLDEAAGKADWRIRFTPTEVGLWRYDVTVKDTGGEATSQTYELLCTAQKAPPKGAAANPGFIRVSKSDPQYFEHDDGSFYYPLGQNVCWASNYEYYLDQMKAYGGNYVRVWLCPWNLQLEDPKEVGKYDLRTAKAIDALLAACRARGIYVQLVLRYHGMQDATWDKNPYNAANGGPCAWPGDFFTDGKAKDLHKRFLDYVAARWGHSPTLFAWELWNEADLAKADKEGDLVAWHREMAAHLKKADAHGHLVTTSVADVSRGFALFELAEIDFVPIHLYTRDLAGQFQAAYTRYRKLRKPIFIGEFSAGFKPADDLGDERGIHLHAGLWLAFTMPFAGNAMPWWWDTFVDKNKLYSHWAALGKFAKDMDRRSKNYELIASQVKAGDDAPPVSLRGLVAPGEAVLWVYDEARIARPEQAGRPLLFAERPLRLHGMLGGVFRVEVWDTYEGKLLSESTVTASDGTLSLTLPKCNQDVAVKVVREAPVKALPRVEW